jgi:hypothetical protein
MDLRKINHFALQHQFLEASVVASKEFQNHRKRELTVSLRKGYQDMIRAHGVPDTAMLMEMSESSLDNRVYERNGQAFTVRQSLRLQQISGLDRFAEEIATLSGGAFLKLPSVDHIDNDSILDKMNQLHVELGDWCKHFAAATKDGEIDRREKADLSAIIDEIHRTLDQMRALTFRVYCRDGERSEK